MSKGNSRSFYLARTASAQIGVICPDIVGAAKAGDD
jgi:hypothetical protein